jgi:hypothetical protein
VGEPGRPDRPRPSCPYHRAVSPLLLLALVGVLALVMVIPTRRLYLAGWSQQALLAYYVAMLTLAVAAAVVRGPARFLVPILIIGFLAPFVTLGPGLDRLLGRKPPPLPPQPRIKDVTPPTEDREPSAGNAGSQDADDTELKSER